MIDRNKIHRLMAIDGGPGGTLQVRMMRKIEEQYPGFLASTDVFAGTSDGALLAMFLASRLPADHEEATRLGLAILDDATVFMDNILRALQPTCLSLACFMTGLVPLNQGHRFRDVIDEAFGDMRVDQIERGIFVPAFDVDTWHVRRFVKVRGEVGNAGWFPIRDMLLATSDLAVYVPTYLLSNGHRYVDGALVANNPAMLAASTFFDMVLEAFQAAGLDVDRTDMLTKVRTLSLGLGEIAADMHNSLDMSPTLLQQLCPCLKPRPDPGTLNWGWFQWLMNRPGILPNMFHHAANVVTEQECNTFLMEENYYRYAPPDVPLAILWHLVTRDADAIIQRSAWLADVLWESGQMDPNSLTAKLLDFVLNRWLGPDAPDSPRQGGARAGKRPRSEPASPEASSEASSPAPRRLARRSRAARSSR